MKIKAQLLDGSAVCVSSLCLAHCLVLPLIAAALPMFGVWARAEWVHVMFVAVAAPLSGLALLPGARQAGGRPLLSLAGLGVANLLIGAFLAQTHAQETAFTVAGSLCLASAHLWNWRRRARHGHPPVAPMSPENRATETPSQASP